MAGDLADLLESRANGRVVGEVEQRNARVAEDRREQVAEVMRNTSGHDSQALETTRLFGALRKLLLGAIVLDHEAEDAVPFAAPADALLLIGPEAGISDAERELARAAGAPLARLGEGLVLRSETAAIAAAAVAVFGTGGMNATMLGD